jgi:hypothetical protein
MLRRIKRRSQRYRGRHSSFSQLGIRHARVHHILVCTARCCLPRGLIFRGVVVEKAGFSRRTRRTFGVHRLIIFTASCSVASGVGSRVVVLAMLVFPAGHAVHTRLTTFSFASQDVASHEVSLAAWSPLLVLPSAHTTLTLFTTFPLFQDIASGEVSILGASWSPRLVFPVGMSYTRGSLFSHFPRKLLCRKRWRFQSHRASIVVSTAGPHSWAYDTHVVHHVLICTQDAASNDVSIRRHRCRQGWFSRRACRTHSVHFLFIFTARYVSEKVATAKLPCLPLLVCLLGMPCTHGSPPSHLLRVMLRRTQRRSQRHRGRHCASSQLGIRHTRDRHILVCTAGVASHVARFRRHRGHKGWFSLADTPHN